MLIGDKSGFKVTLWLLLCLAAETLVIELSMESLPFGHHKYNKLKCKNKKTKNKYVLKTSYGSFLAPHTSGSMNGDIVIKVDPMTRFE